MGRSHFDPQHVHRFDATSHAVRDKAFRDSLALVETFLSKESAQKYLKKSDEILDKKICGLTLFPRSAEGYLRDVSNVRRILAQGWLYVTLNRCAAFCRSASKEAFDLQENFFPQESTDKVKLQGGSQMQYLKRDLSLAGITDGAQQDACYAEFVENIKTYLGTHPEGLMLMSYHNIRLLKESDRFVVHQF